MPLENFSPVSTTFFSPLGLMYQTLLGSRAVPAGVGDVDAAVVADDQVVAAEAVGDHRRLAVGVVGEDLLGAAGDRVEPAVGAERLAVAASSCRRGTRLDLAVEADLYVLLLRDVVEEDLALGVDGRAFGELVAFADELPVLAGDQDLLQLRRARAGLHRRGPVLPQPAHGVGEDLAWRARRCARPSPQT